MSEAFLGAIRARAASGRVIAALAGPPAAGKSTLVETLRMALIDGGLACDVLPMDGFHYDDAVLEARGERARKGAPHTFDVGGLAATLARLRSREEPEVAVPVFDRALEISRGSARIIARETPVVLVEGNWLLLDRAPWRTLAPLFDVTGMIVAEEADLRARLEERWRGFGLTPAEIVAKIEENDLPNARLVRAGSREADHIL